MELLKLQIGSHLKQIKTKQICYFMIRFNSTNLIRQSINPNAKIKPELSIVVPIFNQSSIINLVIQRILENTYSNFELILIDDGSNDGTKNQLLNFNIDFKTVPNLVAFKVFRHKFSKFETYCENFGIINSNSKYCLGIQADMILSHYKFDLKMINALKSIDSIAVISGRGIERLRPIIRMYKKTLGSDTAQTSNVFLHLARQIKKQFISQRSDLSEVNTDLFLEKSDSDFILTGTAGRIGKLANLTMDNQTIQSKKIYIGETVMRGPILYDKDKYFRIGGLDVKRFFQGFDEHDFCARAMLNNYLVGYTPIGFSSPVNIGTSRKKRTILTEIIILIKILTRFNKRKTSTLSNEKKLNKFLEEKVSTNKILN
jgi:glycosyltransferase involved in cell wall biosynthesis